MFLEGDYDGIKSFQTFGIKNIISKKPRVWNAFSNYLYLFKTDDFIGATLHTFSFVIGVVIVQFILAILLALTLNSNLKGARFMRSIMMTPWVVPTVISVLIWMWLFQPEYLVSMVTFGQISDFAILNNPATALTGVSLAALWKQIP